MGPLIMLYQIELFEYTLSQFCSGFTLLLELEWPSSWGWILHIYYINSTASHILYKSTYLMGPLIMFYQIEMFEYTLSQFCSGITLLLELEWPSSWEWILHKLNCFAYTL